MIRKAVMAVCALSLAGCVDTYARKTLERSDVKLPRSSAVVIAVPAAGSFADKTYKTSGAQTAAAIHAAFSRETRAVSIAKECTDLPCLITNAGNANYYVVPEILRWEDRATEWSGKPDKIEIRIAVIDAATMKEVAITIISGKSKWLTMGGDHPQDLLQAPVDAWVHTLF